MTTLKRFFRKESPEIPSSTTANGLDLLLFAATVFAVTALLVRETLDSDTWWQVAIGRDILEHGVIPRVDRFAVAALGRTYHDSHWLFQVALALADRCGGMVGVGAFMVALWGATFLACYSAIRRWVTPPVASVLLFVVAVACSDRFTPRPDLVTCLMIAIFYLRLQSGKYEKYQDLVLLALLQIVWSNSHGLFVIGPFMGACYLVWEVIRRLTGSTSHHLMVTARLFLVLMGASIITPYGVGGWRYALLLMTEAGPTASELFKTLPELMPTFGAEATRFPDFWCFSLLVMGALFSTVLLARHGRGCFPRVIMVLALGVAAATGRRNMALFVVAAAPLIAENLTLLLPAIPFPAPWKLVAATSFLAASWLPLSGRYYQLIHYPVRTGLGASPTVFPPVAFFDDIRAMNIDGHIYNSNNLGGFCLYSGFRPLSDGRWEVYDLQVLTRIFTSYKDPESWNKLIVSYDIKALVLGHSTPEAVALLPSLATDSRWRLIHYDRAASLWVRTDLPGLPPRATFVPFSTGVTPLRIEDNLQLTEFFRLLGERETALAQVRQIEAPGGQHETVLERTGQLLRELGRADEAQRTYEALLLVNDKNINALNELAFFAAQRGDLAGTEAYLLRALTINPLAQDVRANYDMIVARRQKGGGGVP